MAGICGMVDLSGAPLNSAALQAMAEAMTYRAVDGQTVIERPSVGMAHLAFHDTPEAVRDRQPYIHPHTPLIVVADAILFNRRDLIDQLRPMLDSLNPTDSALLAAAYLQWGQECPAHLVGQFAFALWDDARKTFFAAVDPFCARFLHYVRLGSRLYFATDMAAILAIPGIPHRPNPAVLLSFLTIPCGDDEPETVFEAIQWLPAAHTLTFDATNDAQLRRYWRAEDAPRIRYRQDAEYAAHLRELLKTVVQGHLDANGDVVGITVSGGMDSSSLLAMGQHLLKTGEVKKPLAAYSYYSGGYPEYNEDSLVRALAAFTGAEVTFIDQDAYLLSAAESQAAMPPFAPLLLFSGVWTPIMGGLRARGARLYLHGHGGDFLFTGHARADFSQLVRGDWRVLPALIDHARTMRQPVWREALKHLVRPAFPNGMLARLYPAAYQATPAPNWLKADSPYTELFIARRKTQRARNLERDPRRHLAYVLNGGMGIKAGHQASLVMAAEAGLALHMPYLDRRLAEFVLGIPPNQRMRFGVRKAVLRRAMEGLSAPEVIHFMDKVQVAPALLETIYTQVYRPLLESLRDSRCAALGLADAHLLSAALDSDIADNPLGRWRLQQLAGIEQWLRKFAP